ncbi:homoserine kinase [Tissierella creatinophila]|uniref:Homoserine kinase n=1 Tax=Tissierella creatinophila DSM 6911 TaxID=1123403 RepID=A0A1U7M2W7_TISCR|nr:homoserine kinase [Tissierella creatinophila]OLS01657.1 homoserine kinase [Tissierella creatinophila DSM 6911]
MINIRVPATSANLGPGFDSLGIALDLYNKFSFEEISHGLEIIGALDTEEDSDNLVYTSMLKVFDAIGYKPKGIRINIDTDIPVSRGLGSSACCIVAGIMGANKMAGSPLSQEEMFKIATEIEGHPDNIAPALFGGFITSIMEEANIYYNKIDIAKGLKFVAIIPDFPLSTKMAREVLPTNIPYKDAVENVSRVSLLISSLSNGRFDLLKHALKDNLHQPYRGKLIKGFNEVLEKIYEFKALGGYLSGAGPTIMAIINEDDTNFKKEMESYFKSVNYNWKVIELNIDLDGAKVI